MRILKAKYKTTEEFLDSYTDDPPCGSLFCPTTQQLQQKQAVVVEVNFPGLPNKTMLRGHVIWWRAALPRLRVRAGALVTVKAEDKEKLSFVLDVANGREVEAVKRRHPRIPVTVSVRWRLVDSAELVDARLRDISVGGALLVTDEPLDKEDEIILELPLPGSAYPQNIAAKVTHVSSEGYGIRFLYRDGGGTQRLREVVRRLTDSD